MTSVANDKGVVVVAVKGRGVALRTKGVLCPLMLTSMMVLLVLLLVMVVVLVFVGAGGGTSITEHETEQHTKIGVRERMKIFE